MSKHRNSRRSNKQIPEEDLEALDSYLNSRNIEEEKLFQLIKVNVKAKTPNQKKLMNSIKENEITIASGLPGTGKTFLACAEGLKLIKSKNPGKYKRIVLIKSVTTLKSEEIGFLKGSMEEKMAPFVDSFMDNFRKLIGSMRTEKLKQLGLIEVLPIAFARGRSIDNSIIIIDEAQNISMDNIRTLMTRIGSNSKMVIIGDVKQKDIRNKKDSSLEVILERFQDVKGFGTVTLRDENDVVRNPIIKIIEDTFDDIEENGQ
jgi:phosphate starvation-inducible PhoH-like protein